MSATANLTVDFVNVNPVQTVTLLAATNSGGNIFSGGALAGIYNLTVNGVTTPSFCIDVDREAVNKSDYSYTSLSSAPLSPVGPMGSSDAVNIEKLWAAYYGSAVTDSSGVTAAALQVAIWETLGNGSLGYTVTVSGNNTVTTEANTMLSSLSGLTAEAHLEALTSPDAQNYVVAMTDGGLTVALLGGALVCLYACRLLFC
jgi:hypothetical protein